MRFIVKNTIIGAIALSIGLAGAPRAEPDAGPLAGILTAAPDRDRDGIPDQVDNCVATANLEQFDSDHDGLGNDCDLTFIPVGTLEPGRIELTVPASEERRTMMIGQLINNTAQSIQWRLESNAQFFQGLPQGSLRPQTAQALNVTMNTGGLVPGEYHGIVTLLFGSESKDTDITIRIIAPDDEEACTYTPSLYKVEILEDQNSAGDGCCGGNKLEIEVYEQMGPGEVDWPSHDGSTNMKKGDVLTPNLSDDTYIVDAGDPVTVPIYVKVVEHDSGTNGSDDWGDAESSLSFTCSGTGYVDKALTVSLTHNGNGKGKIKVTTRVNWSED